MSRTVRAERKSWPRVAGFGLQGLENQTASTENAITRQFKYSNMLEFIHAGVVPYAQVM